MNIKNAQKYLDRLVMFGLVEAIKNDKVYDFMKHIHAYWDSGCHKFCIIPDGEDFVIKFDRRGDENCLKEAENYREACEEDLCEYFAATVILQKIDGIVFVAQERVSIDEDDVDELMYDSSGYYSDSLDDDERIYAICGHTPASSMLVEFCEQHNINDLHSLNWGMNRLGEYVICDYGGHY